MKLTIRSTPSSARAVPLVVSLEVSVAENPPAPRHCPSALIESIKHEHPFKASSAPSKQDAKPSLRWRTASAHQDLKRRWSTTILVNRCAGNGSKNRPSQHPKLSTAYTTPTNSSGQNSRKTGYPKHPTRRNSTPTAPICSFFSLTPITITNCFI